MIEAAWDNAGSVFVYFSAAAAAAGNGHRITASQWISEDKHENHDYDAFFDLYDVWWDGTNTGDKIVVSYEQFLE